MATQRAASCSTRARAAWTACHGLLWVLLAVGAAAYHRAIGSLLGPARELPASLARGFDQELGFARLASDSQQVKDASADALAACGASTSDCVGGQLPDGAGAANTTLQKLQIQSVFASSLSTVDRVANDKFLGFDDLQDTADSLRNITALLGNLDSDDCAATSAAYCGIFRSASDLVTGADSAKSAVDAISDSDVMQALEDSADWLVLLHALPYVMLLSMLFFLCFWRRDAACCCCGGSTAGCAALAMHLILWSPFLTVSMAIVGMAVALRFGADRITLGSPLKGNPTLQELLGHIETAYPGFWDIVIAPLEEPLDQVFASGVVFVALCVVMGMYGLCLCARRPYTDRASIIEEASFTEEAARDEKVAAGNAHKACTPGVHVPTRISL